MVCLVSVCYHGKARTDSLFSPRRVWVRLFLLVEPLMRGEHVEADAQMESEYICCGGLSTGICKPNQH
jgi:hypothetical protein